MLALIIVPVVELYVVYRIGDAIGFLPTVGLLLLISFVGAWLVRREGSGAWRRIQETLMQGNMPSKEIADGALIVFGGTLLLTPGFFTDALGLSMLIPPLRAPVRNWLVKRTADRTRIATTQYAGARFEQSFGTGASAGGFRGGPVFDTDGFDASGFEASGRGSASSTEQVDLTRNDHAPRPIAPPPGTSSPDASPPDVSSPDDVI